LDLNGATAEELEALPRIGPVLAARIVEDRRKRGFYSSLQELQRVKGIGRATLERLRPLIEIRPQRVEKEPLLYRNFSITPGTARSR
jgi:competence protein ComEA